MDPLGDYTDSDGRGLPSPVEDEFPNPDDEEANNISIIRSVHIFLNDCLSDSRSPSVLKSSLSEEQTNEEDQPSSDPLNVEINYAAIRRDEVEGDSADGMEEVPGEGCDGVVIKQEPEWEDEEIDIVDDHLNNLSKSPRKRIRELKILLRKETEESFEGWSRREENNEVGSEKRYSLRQSACLKWRITTCKPVETVIAGHEKGDIWSDDSDNDPDYAPHDEETEEVSHKTNKKTKRKFALPLKKPYRKKPEHKKPEYKKLLCLYCKNKYKIIVKHLLTNHPNEPEVKTITSLPIKSEERKEALAVLLKKIEENDAREADEEEKQIRENVNVKGIDGFKKITPHASQKWSVCFYCKKKLRKVSRHLILTHSNEPYVKYLMRLPKGSEERKNAFKLITNKGNFAYNQEIIANGEGSIISSRTQKSQDQIHTFESCNYCFGFYKKHLLQQHKEKCFQSYSFETTFEEITRNYEGEEDCQVKKNEIKEKKKRKGHRRKLKPRPANVKFSVCLYCKERVYLISKHLISHHGDKPYMKHLLSLPKGSEERKTAWKLIRNKGNFAYNKEIIAKGAGSIISTKMQKGRDQTSNFLPCTYCLGFFKKQLLQKHQENCLNKSECNKITVNDENEDWNVIPPDCSPMEIIKNLVKGNLVGEESDFDLEIKKNSMKKTACYYCSKLTTKLLRHLEIFHTDKPDVKHVLSLEKGSKERYQALQAIRRKGNFLYNKASLNTTDKLLITRKKSEGCDNLKYLPCEFCFGFYRLNTLIKHVYKCESNTMSTEAKNEGIKNLSELKRKSEINTFCTTLLNCSTSFSSNVNQILLLLKNTEIGTLAKNDKLIVRYGAYQLERGKMTTELIVRKMNCLAKLVVRVNVFESSVSNLFDSFSADFFKTVLKAAMQICMTTKEKVAIRREKSLRTSIRHCCMIAKNDSLIQRDDAALKQINDFFALFAEHWSNLLLPTLLEASEMIKHKDKVSEPEANEENKHTSVIDWVKRDFLQNLNDDKNPVSSANNIDHCSRLFGTKKNVCLFCSNKYKNIFRHWTKSHQDEPEIKKFAKLERFSNEWKSLLVALRNKGNYLHNKRVLQQKKGCFFRKKGRAVLNGYSDYLPCEYCLGFYKAKSLSLHLKCCPLNPLPEHGKPINMRIRKKLQIPLIMNELENESTSLKVVVEQMKNDGLKQTVKNDDLIMKYGRIYLSQKPKHQSTYRGASYRLRNLARILVRCQKCNSQIKILSDCFQPENFGYILSAIKEMSFSRSFKSSSVLRHFEQLRFLILTCILILKNECLLKNNESKLKDLSDCEVMLNRCVLSAQDYKQYDDGICLSQLVNPTTGGGTVVPKGGVKKWKKEETDAISSHFSSHINNGVIPGKLEIVDFINQHENLKSRDWMGVKYQIRNMIFKIERLSSCKEKITDVIGSQMSSDSSESHSKVHKKSNSGMFNPHKLVQPTDKFQTKRPVNEETPSLDLQENTSLQCVEISNEQLTSRNSSDCSMKDLEDLFDDISLSSLHKPLATIGNQKDNFNENCPSDNEERTYLLLTSCDHSQQGARFESQGPGSSVETAHPTPKDAFDNSHSSEQLEGLGLSPPAPNVSLHEPSTRKVNTKNDLVAVCQTGPRSTLITDLQENSSLNQPRCQQSNRGRDDDSQEENKQRSNSSINKHNPIQTSVGFNRYKNKGLHRGWRDDESNAVLSFFSKNIKRGKVPSKLECLHCIEENPCLNLRDWVSVKSKVYNIIRTNKKTNIKPSEKNNLKTTEKNKSFDNADIQDSNESSSESDLDNDFVPRSKKRKISQKEIGKQQWTLEENTAINSFFKEHISNHTVPGKKDCVKCISLNKCLASRSWVVVKSKVHNIITYNKRKSL